MNHEEEIAALSVRYRAARMVAKDMVKRKADQMLLDETEAERVELSKALHAAHADGVTISRLRAMTGAYNNAAMWDPIWNAYTPEVEVDLRRKRGEGGAVDAPLYEWTDETTLQVGEFEARNIKVVDGFAEFEFDNLTDEQYRVVNAAVQQAVTDRAEKEEEEE